MTDAQLIADYLAAKGATICPPRTHAMPPIETWQEMTNRNAAVLRRRRKFEAAKSRREELAGKPAQKPRRYLDLDAIVSLIRDGKLIREAAEAMDTTADSISAKLKRHGLTVAKIREAA